MALPGYRSPEKRLGTDSIRQSREVEMEKKNVVIALPKTKSRARSRPCALYPCTQQVLHLKTQSSVIFWEIDNKHALKLQNCLLTKNLEILRGKRTHSHSG